ncbi:MAG TPA: sodium:calcium antiporter [Phycisphaerales bacterium]|nr:sodium:calcium antiporter [Phycisphaerales bacterium]HMP38691.1 sodium:calcium antiporter [Phycisphaerales bacterium]
MTTGPLAPLLLLGGLLLLVFGGRLLIDGAVGIAARMRVPPLIVGLTVVAWGTSAPELAFNAIAASQGRGALVFGNVVGANICNLALILGIAALMRPIAVASRLLRFEMPVVAVLQSTLLVVALVRLGGGGGGSFTRIDGAALLLAFLAVSVVTTLSVKRGGADEAVAPPPHGAAPRDAAKTISGLVLLGLGGALAAEGAVGTARLLGVPESVVGLTIVAIGTTLPELVTGIIAVRRGQVGLLVGNIVGSCIFNVGAILGLCTLLWSVPIPEGGVGALAVLTVLGVLLLPMSVTHDRRIARVEGVLLLLVYGVFLAAQGIHAL